MKDLKQLLKQATEDERCGLARLLEIQSFSPGDIVSALRNNARSLKDKLRPRKRVVRTTIDEDGDIEYHSLKPGQYGVLQEVPLSYLEIVQQVAGKLGVQFPGLFRDPAKLEHEIIKRVLSTMEEKMTSPQKAELERELQRIARQHGKSTSLVGSAGVFGALGAAQLSGFGVYLAASTALGAVTGAIGVTLPFIVYTTVSSAISVVIGPVGWIGAGLYAIWKLNAPNYKRLVPAILYIAVLRAQYSAPQTEDDI